MGAPIVRYYSGNNTSLTYTYVRLGKDPYVAANVVTSITSSFGARTEIEYQAFTDPARAANYYTKSTDGRLANWGNGTPVIDLFAPIYAVKRVQSSAPAAGSYPGHVDGNAMSAISYRYGGAKLQGGGRGFLGFASLTTVDEQTGIQTTTTYRQDSRTSAHRRVPRFELPEARCCPQYYTATDCWGRHGVVVSQRQEQIEFLPGSGVPSEDAQTNLCCRHTTARSGVGSAHSIAGSF